MAGHELVLNHLIADLSIDRRTAARYLDLLEEMRLIRRLPGLRLKATDTERAVPRLHMVDPILVAPNPGRVCDDRRGAFLESLVAEQDGGFIAIEVERAREVPRDVTTGIDAFRASYPKQFQRGLVMYAGRQVLPIGVDVWAVPISTLWASRGVGVG